jgi:hypothetical protein
MLRRMLLIAAALSLSGTPSLARDPNACLRIGSTRVSAYLVMDGRSNTSCGDVDDIRHASESETARDQAVWFRLDGQDWVVRDPAVVAEARFLFKKVNELGEKQGAVGAKQGAIGAEQGRIGARQAELAIYQISGNATRTEPTAEQCSDRMRELGKRMTVLSDEQTALSAQMTREVATAQSGLSLLLEKAMKEGKAVKVTVL